MKTLKGTWHVDCRVPDVLGMTREGASRILFGQKYKGKGKNGERLFGDPDRWWFYKATALKVTLDYPLNVPYTFEVKPLDEKNEVTLGELLWEVAQAYEKVYQERETYKPWGHGLPDLFFESVTVHEDGRVELGIGS